jgi:hypothetical protein
LSKESAIYTVPQTNGDAPLPKRNGPRGMLPPTWVSRSVKVAYVDAHGFGQESTAALLDWCSMGPVLNLAGERTVLSWDCLRAVTLIND